MATSTDQPAFIVSLTRAIEGECERIVAEEAERAAQRVRDRMADITPRMVMQLARHFDVTTDRDRIIITVRHIETEGSKS